MNRRVTVFLVLFVFFLSIYAAIAFYATNPKPTQPFMSFDIPELLSGSIQSNVTVAVNETMNWHLEVTNKMGSTQLTQTIFRIGNLTTSAPNQTSPATTLLSLGNSTTVVPNGKTATVDFNWKVLNVSSSGELEFLKIEINGQQAVSTVGAALGKDFRLFFELWTFDAPSNTFRYYTWLQVWFSAGH